MTSPDMPDPRAEPPIVGPAADDTDPRLPPREVLAKAHEMLAAGQFREAFHAHRTFAAAQRGNYGAHVALAALLTWVNREPLGREVMIKYFRRRPMPGPALKPEHRPLVLKLRGYTGTRAILGKRGNGDWKAKLRGGHYPTSVLLQKPPFHVRTFTIAGEVLPPAHPLPPT
jgi:hypothetical protein